MRPELRLVPSGLALIAVSYGLARFAYGLFLPEIREDVGLSLAMAGVISGGSYAGYCVAIIASAFLVECLGPRVVAVGAGLVATIGMALIALSASPWILALAVLFAGMSTGLASPPMAAAVARRIPDERQPRANSLINSGTSVGVALSGPVALAATGQWREAYLLFAAVAILVTTWLALTVPGRQNDMSHDHAHDSNGTVPRGLLRREAVSLIFAAAAMGFASAAYWTFGGEVIIDVGALPTRISAAAWIVIGICGLAGGAAGDLIRKFGIDTVHRATLAVLAAASLLLVLAPSQMAAVITSAALFGAAYIMLTGVYLVWGVRIYRDRPALGLSLPFLMIAIGQVIGAPVAGTLIGAANHLIAFSAFAVIALLTMLTPSGSSSTLEGERDVAFAADADSL